MVPQNTTGHPFDAFPWPQNYECPWTRERIAQFQARLNRVAGVASNGRPNLRLIWPADADPAISMITVKGVPRARYRLWTDAYRCERPNPASTIAVVEDVEVDITPPRFMIEQYHVPEESEFNPNAHGQTGQGYYTHLLTVGVHSEACCNGREARNGRLCFGLYREPGDADIEELQRRIKLRDEALHGHRPGERVSEGELAEDCRDLKQWGEQREQHLHTSFREAAMNSLALHGWRLFNTDGGKRSPFHFLPGVPNATE